MKNCLVFTVRPTSTSVLLSTKSRSNYFNRLIIFTVSLMVAMSFCVMQPAFGVEPAEARKLVQLCRDLGRDQGITEKRALREYARECVDDVRSVYEDGTLQAHDTTIDELDMVQIDSEIPKFLQYKKQNFQESSLSESAHN